ncbi:MAG: hypothetical protein ACREBJ_10180 [Nitrosotalea sp.]
MFLYVAKKKVIVRSVDIVSKSMWRIKKGNLNAMQEELENGVDVVTSLLNFLN